MKLINIKNLMLAAILIAGFSFSAMAGDWISAAPLTTPRLGATAVTWNGKVYVFGGKSNNSIVLNTAEVYDPVTNQWDPNSVAPFNYPRYDATAAIFQGKIFLIGGRNNQDALDIVEVYNPVQNSWNTVHELRKERWGLSAVIFKDTLLVLGGMENNGSYSDEIEYYDSSEDRWRDLETVMPAPRAAAFVATYDDLLYICGGTYYGVFSNSFIANSQYQWASGPQMQTGRGYGAMAERNHFLYMLGGETTNGVTNLVEVYNPYSGTIEPGDNMNTARSGLASATVGDTIFAIGGWSANHSQILSSVEYYFDESVTAIGNRNGTPPRNNILLHGYPNPFNGIIRFEIEVPVNGEYNFSLYNLTGQKVVDLHRGFLSDGVRSFSWNAVDSHGSPVASGIYIAVVKSERLIQKLKVIYVK